MIPLIGITAFIMKTWREYFAFSLVINTIFSLWFSVYLVARYGGTPGKLLMGLRIVMVDGSPVTWRAAVLRESITILTSTASNIGLAIASYKLTDDESAALTFLTLAQTLNALAPPWHKIFEHINTVWVWGELLTMLFNKKRRAVHDFIAGTVVIIVQADAAAAEAVRS